MKQNGIGRLGTVLAAFFTAFLVLAAQPAQAKGGDNYQEALTAVTTVADGFYKVQLTWRCSTNACPGNTNSGGPFRKHRSASSWTKS